MKRNSEYKRRDGVVIYGLFQTLAALRLVDDYCIGKYVVEDIWTVTVWTKR